ncbi:ankyrin repeat-containing domain protein, partial [Dendryphion nanum]
MTDSSIFSEDTHGHNAWFYFCSVSVPFVLKTYTDSRGRCLADLLDLLMTHDAYFRDNGTNNTLGIVFLIEKCLNYYDATLRQSTTEPNSTKIYLEDFFVKALLSIAGSVGLTQETQLVRLLCWSVINQKQLLVNRLLQIGVSPQSTSEFYGNQSPIDLYSPHDCDTDIPKLLLENIKGDLALHPDKNGWLSIHRICMFHPSEAPKNALPHLEALLRAGTNPDARAHDMSRVPASHCAASSGFLEALKLLVEFQADVHLVDSGHLTILQIAVQWYRMNVLSYLRDDHVYSRDWSANVSCRPALIGDPLGLPRYHCCTLLHQAAFKGSSEILQILKETGSFDDLERETTEGVRPLHCAALADQPDALQWLLDNGVMINATMGPRRITALHMAFKSGNLTNILHLIEADAQFIADTTGATPELQVPSNSRDRVIDALSQSPVKVPDFVLENLNQLRTFHTKIDFVNAIREGNLEACKIMIQDRKLLSCPLLKCGACTALILALSEGQLEVIDLLLQHDATTSGTPCSSIQANGPLYYSAINIAISKPLLCSRLDRILVFSLRHPDHWTILSLSIWQPLHIAAAFNPDGVDILLKHVRFNERYLRADHSAASLADEADILEYILESRSTNLVDLTNTWLVDGGTALHVAAWNGNMRGLEKLIAHGANINSRDSMGRTPLHLAASSNRKDVVSLLVRHGVIRESVDADLCTPLMVASSSRAHHVISSLLDVKTDRCATDFWGRTALHHAAISGTIGIFIELLDQGWNAYQRDFSGRPVIYYAINRGPYFVSYILARGLDLSHLALTITNGSSVNLPWNNSNLARMFLRRFSTPDLLQYLNTQPKMGRLPLIYAAMRSYSEQISVLLEAGSDLELNPRDLGTALILSCQAGLLSSLQLLVRSGASLWCSVNGVPTSAVMAAGEDKAIVHWLLVGRYIDQNAITNDTASKDTEEEIKLWSGIRQVEVPLVGGSERPYGFSLFDYALDLRENRDTWRMLVPLGWNTVAHLTPLP